MKFLRLNSAQRKALNFTLTFTAVYGSLMFFPTACSNRVVGINGVIPQPKDLNKKIDPKKDPAADAATAAAAAAAAKAGAESCEAFKATLPKDLIADKIDVPEDYDNPSGPKISVFYFGKVIPNTVPILFLNSGPGLDSHNAYKRLSQHLTEMGDQDHYSFIYMDQRGNGCSSYYPQGKEMDTLQRLALYGSKQIVLDAESIRKKLIQSQTWIVAGEGYGAFVAHRYLNDFPRALKAVFAHGQVLTTDGDTRVKDRLKAQIQVLNNYLVKYPNDSAILTTIHTKLTSAVCFEGTSGSGSASQVSPGSSTAKPAAGGTTPPAAGGAKDGTKNNLTTDAGDDGSSTAILTAATNANIKSRRGGKPLPSTPKKPDAPKPAADAAPEKQKVCGLWVIDQVLPDLFGNESKWDKLHAYIGNMVSGDDINKDGIQTFLNQFYFGKTNPLNHKTLARKVIDMIDRNTPPLDFYHCNQFKQDLLKDGVDLDKSPVHECVAVLQDSSSDKNDTSTALQRLTKNPLPLDSIVSTLKANSSVNFYLYSGTNDPFGPSDSFKEEVTALTPYKNFHYKNFPGIGSYGFSSEPQIWQNLKTEAPPAAATSTTGAASGAGATAPVTDAPTSGGGQAAAPASGGDQQETGKAPAGTEQKTPLPEQIPASAPGPKMTGEGDDETL